MPHPGPDPSADGKGGDRTAVRAGGAGGGTATATGTATGAGRATGAGTATMTATPTTATTKTEIEQRPPAVRTPGFASAVAVVLTPVLLMLLRAIGELTLDDGTGLRNVLDTIGEPVIALLAGVLLASILLGVRTGREHRRL